MSVVDMSSRPCGCDPGAAWTCARHLQEMADSVSGDHRNGLPALQSRDVESAESACDRYASFLAALDNAIELSAGLPYTDRLLALQVEALRERERV